MGFIESIAGKGDHFIVNALRGGKGDAVFQTAGHAGGRITMDKGFAFPGHHVVLLLAHGAADLIAAAITEACQVAHNLHDLLLIDHAAIGDAQNGFQLGGGVVNGLRVILALDEARDRGHGPGTVQ